MSDFKCEETKFGFRWGPATIERCISDPKFGVVITVTTPKGRAHLRVTPTGFIRTGKVQAANSNICDV
jgi:hypothetical protein